MCRPSTSQRPCYADLRSWSRLSMGLAMKSPIRHRPVAIEMVQVRISTFLGTIRRRQRSRTCKASGRSSSTRSSTKMKVASELPMNRTGRSELSTILALLTCLHASMHGSDLNMFGRLCGIIAMRLALYLLSSMANDLSSFFCRNKHLDPVRVLS